MPIFGVKRGGESVSFVTWLVLILAEVSASFFFFSIGPNQS